jgi:hypothetical protein
MAENTNDTGAVVEPVTPAEPVPVSLKDDDIVEVVWKGETVRKPWKEARANIQMQEDYTRSKQELSRNASAVKELNDKLTARQQEMDAKELALDKLLGRTSPGNVKQDLSDDEVPTVKAVREMLAELKSGLTTATESTINTRVGEVEQRALFQQFDKITEQTVEALTKENPLLATIPELDTVLKRQAMKDKPTTQKEMTDAMVKAGKAIAKKLDDAYAERRKQETLKKNELTTKGPIHEGGAPQFKVPDKTFIKKGTRNTIDYDAIEREVLSQYDED